MNSSADQPSTEKSGSSDRGPRLREIPLRLIWPNLVTVLAICFGLTGMRFAIEGDMERAVYLVLVAAVLDGIDGRLARMLKATSKFGAQMDSLADIVNFGVVPAILLYSDLLYMTKPFGWIAALIFTVACGLRLARFNVMSENPGRATWQGEYFVGVPAPSAAVLLLVPVYLGVLGMEPGQTMAVLATAYALLVAVLMVSRLPVWSGKALGARVPRDAVVPILLMVVIVAMLLYFYTFLTLLVGSILLLISIPVSTYRYNARFKAWQIQENTGALDEQPDISARHEKINEDVNL
ncbi:CDP-diacylglycerol--serine O-phosphatidyltransferase [Notoacmeibacter sp. MSK16QG-6]|uniref:CDP-diacylglycerol--serine O-phosphatidyltransferase n=1 Tax=Notoacmeibacter sp. MSK16QG-6 TaxID=2957982 RepID=UPI0020A1C0D9|nr:CDP-diacylglycerol--serine O-phosphatidyltransferase [Notoacmeibacter sp. MSK16QG-6]MCP1198002.1 CDP-diacylglycerol--serine O-phosphatidyltransferase [Notoacmeibacter sp. MSK16QG-6]